MRTLVKATGFSHLELLVIIAVITAAIEWYLIYKKKKGWAKTIKILAFIGGGLIFYDLLQMLGSRTVQLFRVY